MEEIRAIIGCATLIYQDVDAMKQAWAALNPPRRLRGLVLRRRLHVTGDVSAEDFAMRSTRSASAPDDEDSGDLALAPGPAERRLTGG